MEEVVVFHYHLLAGGVTTVILQSARALLEQTPRIGRIRLVCGSRENADAVLALLDPSLRGGSSRVELEVVPMIGYRDRIGGSARRQDSGARREAAALARTLVERFGGPPWWIHNYHLGKNAVFTEAVLIVADRHPDQRIVLHIHDFPESGRFENLAELRRVVSRPLYPSSRNVRYAVINERDRSALVRSGLPETAVFPLSNPAPPPPPPAIGRREVGDRLARRFAGEFPRFDPGRPMLLYPVRTIRRKNVLEAALLARLLPGGMNLVVTLPGLSAQETAYSSAVESCYRRGLVAGLWGIGSRIEEAGVAFADLAAACDAFVSSSVQEGFGYLFVESKARRKRLIARRLDVLAELEDALTGPEDALYRDLRVPIAPLERRRLAAAYSKRLRAAARLYPSASAERLREEARRLLAGPAVDFSFLPVEAQIETLRRSADERFAREIAGLNASIFRPSQQLPPDRSELIERTFGLARYAVEVRELFGSFERVVAEPADPVSAPSARGSADETGPVHERLLALFADIGHFRLLYDPG